MDKQILSQIKPVMEHAVATHFVAGANILVYRHGIEDTFYAEAGMADTEKSLPIRRDTIFRLYSMTKPITAAAVMKLVECGTVDLLDPVADYLPGFRNQRVYCGGETFDAKRDVTILDLLSMTSGLPYPGESAVSTRVAEVFAQNSSLSTVELANALGECGLEFQPGERWMYGTSADVAAAVVELASGKRFGDFVRDEFFVPLGMEDTAFFVPVEKQPRLAQTYASTDGKLKVYSDSHLRIANKMEAKPAFESGGAGLSSTIDDYMKFAQMLLNDGTQNGMRILSEKTVKRMATASLTDSQRAGMSDWAGLVGFSYGHFMRVLVEPGRAALLGSAGEYGWDGWLGAYFCNDPAEDLSVVFMSQRTDTGTTRLTRTLRNIISAAI
jgi:CubicO group peptidase (beta-lactamase class C family)